MFLTLVLTRAVRAEEVEPDYACIGAGLTDYMLELQNAAGPLTNIKLLTPAFNMTNNRGVQIAQNIDPAALAGISGIAGNSYNTADGNTVTGWVQNFRSGTGWSLPVLITETGDVTQGVGSPNQDLTALAQQMAIVQGDGSYIGAALFNAFGTNPGWQEFALSDAEIQTVCGGSTCGKIGVNSAIGYPMGDDFYSHAGGLGMQYVVGISNADSSTTNGVDMAHARGITPVIRVGTVFSAGPDASVYGDYLAELDAHISATNPGKTVYAIAGPNEPQSECWATPDCTCGDLGNHLGKTIFFTGEVNSHLPIRKPNNIIKGGSPVGGAVVAAYKFTKEFDSGNSYGFVDLHSYVATDGNGKYTLGIQKDIDGEFDDSVFVGIWCNGEYVDGWKLSAALLTREKNFTVACDDDYYSPAKGPPLKFDLAGFTDVLSCELLDTIDGPDIRGNFAPSRSIGPGSTKPITIIERGGEKSYVGAPVDENCTNCPPAALSPAVADMIGRGDISKVMTQYPTKGYQIAGNGYSRGVIRPYMEGEDPDDLVPLCEDIKYSNSVLPDQYDPYSRTTAGAYGPAALLATPGMWEQYYWQLDPNTIICKRDEADEVGVKLCQIEPHTRFKQKMDCGYEYSYDYFPYLTLIGNKDSSALTQAFGEATNDSYEPNPDVPETTAEGAEPSEIINRWKDFEHQGDNDTQYKAWNFSKMPSGRTEFSHDSALEVTYTEDPDTNPIGAVFASPIEPFGQRGDEMNPDVEGVEVSDDSELIGLNARFVKAGRGDYQFGRPFQLCSTGWFNEEVMLNEHAGNLKHEASDGYRYLTNPSSGIPDWLVNLACTLNWSIFFHMEDECETTNPSKYTISGVEMNVRFPVDSTKEGWDPEKGPTSCIPFEESVVGSCNPASNLCRITCESLISGSCSQAQIDACNAGTADPSTTVCTYYLSSPTTFQCEGDIVTDYEGYVYKPFDPALSKAERAVFQQYQTFASPIEIIWEPGHMYVTDYPVSKEENFGQATKAFQTTGPGGADFMDAMGKFVRPPYKSTLPAPPVTDPSPVVIPGPGGDPEPHEGRGDGPHPNPQECDVVDEDTPPPLVPPWTAQTPLPENGYATYYNHGLMEVVYQNRLDMGQVTPCPECVGMIALLRQGDMNKRLWVNIPGYGVDGPLLVVDMPSTELGHDRRLWCLGWILDAQYELFARWGRSYAGPIFGIKVCNTQEECTF